MNDVTSPNASSAPTPPSAPAAVPPSAPAAASRAAHILRVLEIPTLLAVLATLVLCAVFNVNQAGLLTLAAAVAALVIFFAGWEASRPPLRQLMPTIVLAALATAGRMLFAAVPDVKPVTAICVMAGAMFGRQCGFMTGALSALASNVFFGQGPWTPWQMFAWGLIGYLAGCIGEERFGRHPWLIPTAGVAGALLFGLITNGWFVIGYIHPLTWGKLLAAFAAALPMDLIHAVSTVIFLGLLYAPWAKKFVRINRKFAL